MQTYPLVPVNYQSIRPGEVWLDTEGKPTEGFSVAGGLLPALGFALTLFVIGKKQLMPLFFVGYFLVIVSKITVFEAAIFGVCVILLVMTFSNKKAEEA